MVDTYHPLVCGFIKYLTVYGHWEFLTDLSQKKKKKIPTAWGQSNNLI